MVAGVLIALKTKIYPLFFKTIFGIAGNDAIAISAAVAISFLEKVNNLLELIIAFELREPTSNPL